MRSGTITNFISGVKPVKVKMIDILHEFYYPSSIFITEIWNHQAYK